MNAIRFSSVLNSGKWGYEFTNDSMTFWDASRQSGGVLHCAMGYYETYGDGNVQHSGLCACHAEHFTDYLLSFVTFLLANPQTEFKSYVLGLDPVHESTIRFLAGIVYRDDKRQWYNLVDRKLSSAESKQYDKRWIQVPTWADGTVSSAVSLFGYSGDYSYSKAPRELLHRYALHNCFFETLRNELAHGKDWEKITSYQADIPGDYDAAFRALSEFLKAHSSMDYARRLADCALHNSKAQVVDPPAAAAA